MDRNLTVKSVVIIVLVAIAALTLYPPTKTLKSGIDLAGGTSLIYEIDTHGLEPEYIRGLSGKMITVLRRRIDPANVRNLIWRPQGNTRFEIQMPLASAEARERRWNYDEAKDELLKENINRASILRSLKEPIEERTADFNDFARGEPNRLAILEDLAKAYDERKELRDKRDSLKIELKSSQDKMSAAGLDLEQIQEKLGEWAALDVNDQQLTESLKEFLGSEDNLELLTGHVKMYAQREEVREQLTNAETGKNVQYNNAQKELDKLNLSEDQIDLVLTMSSKSARRSRTIKELKVQFADRADKIDKVVEAFGKYRKFQGRLDDPKDLRRMLKGAGVLEFRVLPTLGHPDIDNDEMNSYVEMLKEKGPKYASTKEYVWCEIENIEEWIYRREGRFYYRIKDAQDRPPFIAQFGNKYYVLAGNKRNESLLHAAGEQRTWKLERAYRTQDSTGLRAIGFVLDERGEKRFYRLTKDNLQKPLCIVLDALAISAPNIQDAIGRRGIISGSFSEAEQQDMVDKLNAGSLPGKLIEPPISERTIGPSIGAINRDKGIRAGFVGLAVVVFCMLIYYMLAGGIADVALLMNILFVLAIMALLRATFTLPGIAGIILTIGMSVDANVLIFERIREEQQKGSSLRIAVRNGYQRAFRTIFDANLTTFITAAILFWIASEEIKGFAIVLMLGIASSMFTALFVTRVIFDYLLARRIIKEHLLMLSLIHKPNINWMGSRPIFFCISGLLIATGLLVFFTRKDKYDIEFTGGTAAVINLKDGTDLSRQDVVDRIREIGSSSDNPALATVRVYSVGEPYKQDFYKQYEINTTETNKTVTTVTFSQGEPPTVEGAISVIKKTAGKVGAKLNNLIVTQHSSPAGFVVTTSEMNKSVVSEVLSTAFPDAEVSEPEIERTVDDAILAAFGDNLELQRDLRPEIVAQEKIAEELADYPELANFLGGIKIICKIERAATGEEIERRFKDLRFKPDMQNLNWSYDYEIFGAGLTALEPNVPVESFVYVSAEPEAGIRELTEDEWTGFVENETAKVLAAGQLETSLPRVTQIDPSVGAEQKTRALIAIILSLFAIIGYIWLRFGNFRYGIAAIIALVHDVCITLGAVTACTYIASTTIGEKLLIGDFKINLAMIAAFLTLIGYSLNDTIVIFDRIRENRRKGRLNSQIITNSINQTISRTLLTSFTTFIVVLIMYIFGGQALRGFTFAIGFGIIVGTYSSIAIAAPVLLLGGKAKEADRK
ncbi:MAG: protein translocase subunit SecD [Planctomycetota bacterium]|jgi:SecD/SecF fusion protein